MSTAKNELLLLFFPKTPPPLNFPPSQVEKSLLLLLLHFRSGLPPALSLFLFPLFLPHTFLPRRNSIHLNLLLFNLPPSPHSLLCLPRLPSDRRRKRGGGPLPLLFTSFAYHFPEPSPPPPPSLRTTEAAATVGRSVGEGSGIDSLPC